MTTKSDKNVNDTIKIPKWLLEQEGVTKRGWKARKRSEVKQALKAIDTLLLGCAFTPCHEEIMEVVETLQKIRKGFSVKSWVD